MKAIVVEKFGGPEVLQYQDVPDPTPGEGEVLVKTHAASVNFADIGMRNQRYHRPGALPFIPGLDFSGTVVAVGSGVEGFQPGQKVAGFSHTGTYAELVVAPADLLWPVPDGLDMDVAAAFPTVGITAYNLLTLAGRLSPGETVLIHAAAGGVGTMAVQLARLLGAGQVIGTVGSDAKSELARRLGCDLVINYRKEDFVAATLQATANRGADLILDSIGGDVFAQGMQCLADFGRLVLYGAAAGEPAPFNPNVLRTNNRAVIGYSSGHYRKARPAALRPAAEAVLNYLKEGKLEVIITQRFPLREAAEAHRLIESRASTGKVLLVP